MRPMLVTLEGDIIPSLSGEEIEYLRKYNPELLGFWLKLIKGVGKVVGAGFRGIQSRVKRKRAERRAAAVAEYNRKKQELYNIIMARRAQIAAIEKQKNFNKNMAMMAIPAIAALAFLLG